MIDNYLHFIYSISFRYRSKASFQCGSMVYLSTDYIFSGEGNRLYEITDPAEPVNIYGRTKLEGELVVREH